jgi:hypothetical protein
MQKFETLRGKIPKIVATFVSASSQGQRTHSARTKNSAAIYWQLEGQTIVSNVCTGHRPLVDTTISPCVLNYVTAEF